MNGSKYYQIQDLFPHLKNPHKYVGTRPITMRSGWEIKFASGFLDLNPSVVEWSSESVVIQYFYPVDKKWHRYFTDFWMKVRQDDGTFKEFIIEIKPSAQTRPPKEPKRKTKGYINQVQTFIKNEAKWNTARAYCADRTRMGRPTDFMIITEHDIPGVK